MSQEDKTTQQPAPQAKAPEKPSPAGKSAGLKGVLSAALIPTLSVFTALVIGAIIISASSPDVLAAWRNFFQDPLNALSVTWKLVHDAYLALFQGAFGNPSQIAAAFTQWRETGDTRPLLEAWRYFSESLVIATPYIFAGLAVALGFRGNMFNIGAEGQLFVGGLASAYVGYAIKGLPAYIHLPLALLAGILAGAIWGAIPGLLKARTGAHEVINTIMMNYISYRLTDYLLTGPMARPDKLPITPEIQPSAYLPSLFERPMRLHWGFFLALAMAAFLYWFLFKTTRGMEIRMVGLNPNAARTAGVRISFIMVLTMALSGGLAGLAGANQILGVDHRLARAFSSGYGFDSIALALLGKSHPVGVVLASLLFGFLRGGAARMQSVAGVPVEIIRIIQGMVIVFVAAPAIIRSLYRLKAVREEEAVLQRGWS
ncbi:MAG: ABC transporter permease [Anaerolineales bacterium]|nr:ABC transporter permease [Anaerolineales bacterium]